jgi:hypothetical protein
MTVTDTPAYRVRRALSPTELTAILDAAQTANDTKQLLTAVFEGVFTPLLTTVGESLTDYGPGHKLDVCEYAIPAAQWAAIADACQQRADAFGTRADVALALADLMPASYEDPTITVAARPAIDHRPYEHMLSVSREACDEIAAASTRCDQLGAFFGVDSAQYLTAVRSWQRGICAVFGMTFGATTRISREGPLSLRIHPSSGYVYALIFHPQARVCTNPGCGAVIDDDGHAHPPRTGATPCAPGQHHPSYPLQAPQPGTWSLHS